MQIVTVLRRFTEVIEHDVIALLVAQPPDGNEVHLVAVDLKIGLFLRFLVYLVCVDNVLDNVEWLVVYTAALLERPDDALRDADKFIIILELALEVRPEHAVLPLVLELHADVVVDPHDAALCRYGECAERTGKLIGVEVYRKVIFLAVGEIQTHKLLRRVKGHEGIYPRYMREVLYSELLREIDVPEALSVGKVQVDLIALIVEVPQEVHY